MTDEAYDAFLPGAEGGIYGEGRKVDVHAL